MNRPSWHGRLAIHLLGGVAGFWFGLPTAMGVPGAENDSAETGVEPLVQLAPTHPPVALTVGSPSAEEQRSCIEFNTSGPTNQCSFNGIVPEALVTPLLQSDRFASVSLNPGDVPHVLTLAATTYMGEGIGSILSGGLAGATLNLIPVKQKKMVRIEADLRWQGLPLQTLGYELPVVARTHLFQHDDGLAEMHQQLTQALIADIDAKGLLTPEFLFTALDASDYERDLKVPEEIVGLPRTSKRLYADPFLGVWVAYGGEGHDAGISVFVYPVAKADWFDDRALVRQQARKAIAEMRTLAAYTGATVHLLGDVEVLGPDAGAHSGPVAVQRVNLVREDGLLSEITLSIYRRGDKFIKVRATNVDDLPLATLADAIEVPAESGFMALLRAGARERSARTPTHESAAHP